MCLSTLNLTMPRSFKFHSKDDGLGEFWLAGYSGIEPRFNETLYNEVLGITNDFLYPSNSKIYEKKKKTPNNETSLQRTNFASPLCRWPLRTPTPLKSSSVDNYRPGGYSLT